MNRVRDALVAWEKPTLVVWGADDTVLPVRVAERFVETIPGASGPALVDGASHFLQEDRPAEVAAAHPGVPAVRQVAARWGKRLGIALLVLSRRSPSARSSTTRRARAACPRRSSTPGRSCAWTGGCLRTGAGARTGRRSC